MFHLPPLRASLATLVLLGACTDVPAVTAPAPGSDAAPVVSSTTVTGWQEVVDGDVGPGTSYRLYMPHNWNGKLVTYAHGIVAPFMPVALPAEGDGMAAIFGAQGFAVALSSYKETGLAIKDGAQRTHQLRGIFASRFGQPARSYLVGSSMGGFIVASLAERFPEQYDGVLPMCGVVGGFAAEFQYVLDARVLFDALYGHPLPGTATAVAMPSDPFGASLAVGAVQQAAVAAIQANPMAAGVLAMMDQTRMPLPAPNGPLTGAQFGEFVVTPLLLHAIFINDIVKHAHGQFAISNATTQYSSVLQGYMPAGTIPWLNATVDRVEGDPAALNWVQHNGETTGRITLPTLTLHTANDTWVPIVTESIYRDRVVAAGRAESLVQRTTPGFGHCRFTPQEIGQGLADLVNWVEHGVKPTP